MKWLAIRRGEQRDEELIGRILCHDVRGDRSEVVFRKGHALRADDIPLLTSCRWDEIHLLDLGTDGIGQREAGERLAAAVLGVGVRIAPSGHKHVLKATERGLLEIDVTALHRLNAIPGIAVFTLFNDQPVSAGQVVAQAQITPLGLEREKLEEAESIAGKSEGLVRVIPFAPRGVVVWVRERSGTERERALRAVAGRLAWFGCSIRDVVELPDDEESIRSEIESRVQSDATLFLVSGANALDRLDPVFGALEFVGAKIRKVGMPVHPGTLLWIASWGEITVIGLPSCGLATQITAFDLVLPKILARGAIGDDELAALGHGGILHRGMEARFAPYGRSERSIEQEPADEPVR